MAEISSMEFSSMVRILQWFEDSTNINVHGVPQLGMNYPAAENLVMYTICLQL